MLVKKYFHLVEQAYAFAEGVEYAGHPAVRVLETRQYDLNIDDPKYQLYSYVVALDDERIAEDDYAYPR